MSVTLYHFTAAHLARRIRNEGITLGCISKFDSCRVFSGIEKGWIWLTEDSGWHQEWCAERQFILYDRAAVRFTVEIPEISFERLSPAREVLRLKFPNSLWLLDIPGSDKYWLYRGKIFRKWLVKVDVKPEVEYAEPPGVRYGCVDTKPGWD